MNESARRDVPGMVGSAIFIVVGAIALYYSRDFSALGAVFPRTIAVSMMVLSAVYIAVSILRPKAPAPQPRASSLRRIALVVVMLLWATYLEPVGFLTASVAAFAALLVIANYDRWTPHMAVIYTAVAAVVIGGLYAIFRFGLQVPLPQGILI
ncbi:MAG: tripartite tricarboxylate transporter TctB family protein [Pseudomonadota bacterium]